MAHESRQTFESSTHTSVLAAFHCDPRNLRFNGASFSTLAQSHRGLGFFLGLNTDKQMGAASGTWSLTVKRDASTLGTARPVRVWKDPEDVWVQIKVQVDGQNIDTMLGLIDSVSDVVERVEMGKRIEIFTISGRDIGKVLEQTEVWVNFFNNPDSPVRGQTVLSDTMMRELVGTPAHFMRVLLELWVGSAGVSERQYMLPSTLGGTSFYDLLLDLGRVRGIEPQTDTINGTCLAPQLFQIDQTGGRLWDVLQEWSNGLLNELFIDLAPRPGSRRPDYSSLQPRVVFRERRFPTRSDDGRTNNRTAWDNLRTHTLTKGDVLRSLLAKGGASTRFNYWILQLEGLGTEGFNVAEILQHGLDGVEYGRPGNIPIFNNGSIALHGVRRFQASSRYVPFPFDTATSVPTADFVRLSARWLKKLHDWYAIAPRQISGSLETTRIFPEIRLGERVRVESDDGPATFYIEGVAHSYTYPGAGKTTLTLTRGEFDDEDLLGDLYDSYDAPTALTADQEQAVLSAALTGLSPDLQVFGVDVSAAQTASLEIERDGRSDDQPPDASASDGRGVADGTEPSVGDAQSTPSPNPTGSVAGTPDPMTVQQGLETGAPLDTGGGT